MKFCLAAAICALTLGAVDVSAAHADWREAIMGPQPRSNEEPAYRAPTVKTSGKQARSAAPAVDKSRVARRQGGNRLVQTASFTSNGGWAASGQTTGVASYYWEGQRTATGAVFNPNAMTAAHRTLPFGTRVLVTNLSNGRSVTVTINDRGPFVGGRIIDLSRGAASVIGMTGAGVARVSLAVQR